MSVIGLKIVISVMVVLRFVRILFGVDVEVSTYNGLRLLHWAAANDHISIVKELIEERNTEINARNDNGDTALRLARQQYKPDVASYLVSHSGIE